MASSSRNINSVWFGVVLMFVGLGLVIWELQTGQFQRGMGAAGYAVAMALGCACSVWGLKELVAHLVPGFSARGFYFRLPREGFAFLVMTFFFFGGSVLGRSNLLMMVFSLMVGAFLINGWFTFTMLQGARPRRVIPERSMAGEPVGIVIELENQIPWLSARLMRVHDRVTHGNKKLEADVLFVQVLPRSHTTGRYQFVPMLRGRYEFNQIDVTTRFPLGLVQRGVGRELQQTLLVYPRVGHLHAGWHQQRISSNELISQMRGAAGAFQDEFHQLREYRVGDDRRMIHWRTSARLNELMISEYQQVRDRDLFLIVDAWLPENPTEEQSDAFERGLRFATTVAMDALHANRHSFLFVELLGRQHFSWRGDVERNPDSLLDELATLEPHQETSLETMRDLIVAERNRSRRLVVISTRPTYVRQIVTQWKEGVPPDVEFFGTSRKDLANLFSDSELHTLHQPQGKKELSPQLAT